MGDRPSSNRDYDADWDWTPVSAAPERAKSREQPASHGRYQEVDERVRSLSGVVRRRSRSRDASQLSDIIRELRAAHSSDEEVNVAPPLLRAAPPIISAPEQRTQRDSAFATTWGKLLAATALTTQRQVLAQLERTIRQFRETPGSMRAVSWEDLGYLGAAVIIMRRHPALANAANHVLDELWPGEAGGFFDGFVPGHETLTFRDLSDEAFRIALNALERAVRELPNRHGVPPTTAQLKAMLTMQEVDDEAPTIRSEAWRQALALVLAPESYNDFHDSISRAHPRRDTGT